MLQFYVRVHLKCVLFDLCKLLIVNVKATDYIWRLGDHVIESKVSGGEVVISFILSNIRIKLCTYPLAVLNGMEIIEEYGIINIKDVKLNIIFSWQKIFLNCIYFLLTTFLFLY